MRNLIRTFVIAALALAASRAYATPATCTIRTASWREISASCPRVTACIASQNRR